MGSNRRKVYGQGETDDVYFDACKQCGCRHFERERGMSGKHYFVRLTCRNCGRVVTVKTE